MQRFEYTSVVYSYTSRLVPAHDTGVMLNINSKYK